MDAHGFSPVCLPPSGGEAFPPLFVRLQGARSRQLFHPGHIRGPSDGETDFLGSIADKRARIAEFGDK